MSSAAFADFAALKDRIRAGTPTLGVFVKTPSVQTVEILAASGADFLTLDAEHAPFGLDALDRCIMAARGAGILALVRVPAHDSREVLQVLDLGAAGVIVPHICSAADAEQAVAATRYRGGARGFSPSGRSGAYGAMPAADYREASDRSVIVVGQTEDAEAVTHAAEIAAVPSLDALFIGRADLSVSLGVGSIGDPAVARAVEAICAAGRNAGKATGIFLPSTDEVPRFREMGVSLFIVATDQSLLGRAARSMADAFRASVQ